MQYERTNRERTVSVEWIEAREDELAHMITANEHVQRLRVLAPLLLAKGWINQTYYHDMLDSLDYIADALRVGKRNTGKLRNGEWE